MKLGLCCLLHEEKQIAFKSYTFKRLKEIKEKESLEIVRQKIFTVWNHNIETLQKILDFCYQNSIQSYRISSDLFPKLDLLLDQFVSDEETREFQNKLRLINTHNIILSMHPGQHVCMSSPHQVVITNSIKDLKYHLFVAEPLGCSEINIHIGGAYGDKELSKKRFVENMRLHLLPNELKCITIENDELCFSVKDVVDVAQELGIRVTYDIHHQRCHELKYPADGSEETYNSWCNQTWTGYSYQRYHMSTPRDGYSSTSKSRPHHDYIDPSQIPFWLINNPRAIIDIEAKHKQKAIFKLVEEMKNSN